MRKTERSCPIRLPPCVRTSTSAFDIVISGSLRPTTLRARTGSRGGRLMVQRPLTGLHLPPPFAARARGRGEGRSSPTPAPIVSSSSSLPVDGSCRTSPTRWSPSTASSSGAAPPAFSHTSRALTRCCASWTTRCFRPSARWSTWANSNASASRGCSSGRHRRPVHPLRRDDHRPHGARVRQRHRSRPRGRDGEFRLRARAAWRWSATADQLTPASLRRPHAPSCSRHGSTRSSHPRPRAGRVVG